MGGNVGVIFDLDETLVDRYAALTRYAAALWREQGGLVGLDEAQFLARFHELDNRGRTPRKLFFSNFTAQVMPQFSAAEFGEHFFDGAWAEPLLFADAVEVLTMLRARGYRVGIISNGSQRPQSAKIRNSPLRELVDTFLVSESVGVKKPDPAIFAAMADSLALDVGRSWFVGDDPVADVIGAARSGFQAVWLERYTPWPIDEARAYVARIETLSALRSIILDA